MSLSHKQAHQSAYNKGGDGFKCNVVSIDKVIDPNNSLNMMRTLNACDGNGWCLGENKEGNIIKKFECTKECTCIKCSDCDKNTMQWIINKYDKCMNCYVMNR